MGFFCLRAGWGSDSLPHFLGASLSLFFPLFPLLFFFSPFSLYTLPPSLCASLSLTCFFSFLFWLSVSASLSVPPGFFLPNYCLSRFASPSFPSCLFPLPTSLSLFSLSIPLCFSVFSLSFSITSLFFFFLFSVLSLSLPPLFSSLVSLSFLLFSLSLCPSVSSHSFSSPFDGVHMLSSSFFSLPSFLLSLISHMVSCAFTTQTPFSVLASHCMQLKRLGDFDSLVDLLAVDALLGRFACVHSLSLCIFLLFVSPDPPPPSTQSAPFLCCLVAVGSQRGRAAAALCCSSTPPSQRRGRGARGLLAPPQVSC